MTALEAAGQESAARQATIRSVEELVQVLGSRAGDGVEFWFRGHCDITWTLVPSAHRTHDLRVTERSMLARFRQQAAAVGQPYGFDEWGWITYAQHHGLPTRLLDWSQSPLVALFFSCQRRAKDESDIEPDGEFFWLRPHELNDEAGDSDGGYPRLLTDTDSRLCDYLPGRDANNRSKPRAVVAPMAFDRIRFQTGTFTVSQVPNGSGPDEPLRESRSVESAIVPSDAKRELREELEVLGFNDATIYRDLDRIAKRIMNDRT